MRVLWLAIGIVNCLSHLALLLVSLLADGLLGVSGFFAIFTGVAHNKLLYDLPSFTRLLAIILSNEPMSILEGVKASNYRQEKPRFVIKPKVSAKEREEVQNDQINATDADVILFIEYMISKSIRLKELL